MRQDISALRESSSRAPSGCGSELVPPTLPPLVPRRKDQEQQRQERSRSGGYCALLTREAQEKARSRLALADLWGIAERLSAIRVFTPWSYATATRP